jgi:type II secretory pathway component PulC
MRRIATSVVLAFLFAGCSAAPAKPVAAPEPKKAQAPAAPAVANGHVARGSVDRVLRQGPPWLLRRVLREEVVRDDGQLTGWRITALPEDWTAIDLKPGDVVTKVNGIAIVTPDDAWNAWKKTASAKEIRVDLQRAGAARELVIPIDGQPTADVVRALESDEPPPRVVKSPTQRGTIVIEGNSEGDLN